MKKQIKKYAVVITGAILMAISFNLFQAKYNFVSGGISGLSIILKKFIPLNEGIFIFLTNIFLLIISYIVLGKEKTKYTVLGSIIYPISINLTAFLSQYINFNDIDPILISIIGGLINGLGLGLVYKSGFTTGGTDILNQILSIKCKIPLGKSILYIDGIIVILSALVFGIPSMVYSLIMIFLTSYISNKTMLELGYNKVMYIYTNHYKEIKKYLTNFYYDITIFETVSGYSEKKKKLYMCSVSSRNYYEIKEGIKLIDPNAFIVVTNAYELQNANVSLRKSLQ